FAQRAYGGGPPAAPGAPGAQGTSTDGRVVNVLTIRARDQVMLKVTVAEIQRDIAKQLGITTSSATFSWGSFTQFNPFAINGVIADAGGAIGYPRNATTTALTAHNPANTLSATLQAFERYGVSRILAEPTVSAVSGESAKLTVGGEIPVPTAPSCTVAGGCQIGTEFKPFGVTLRFTPVVLAEGRILLHLATEVTEIDPQNSFIISGTPVPSFLTRKNETSVEIPSGGSIASAGLLQTRSQQVINGLPGLLDLPILGALFRSNDYKKQETELMIIVTPYIIKPVKPDEIAKPTDGFADASDPQAWLLGRVNRLYAAPGNPEAIKDYKGPVGFIQD
ncbi:MAG TPA: secretin, partial [Methylocella sp.]|nr:secretin [Methylocella sp.]